MLGRENRSSRNIPHEQLQSSSNTALYNSEMYGKRIKCLRDMERCPRATEVTTMFSDIV